MDLRIPGRKLPETEASKAQAFIGNLLGLSGPGQTAFPGAQPVSLSGAHLHRLLNEDFFVSEKADGVRVLLFASVDRRTGRPYVLLLDRRNDVYSLEGLGIPLASNPRAWVSDTLIDGELVNDSTDGQTQKDMQFLGFDTLLYAGERTFEKPYYKRTGVLRSLIVEPHMRRVAKDPEFARIQPFRWGYIHFLVGA